MDLENTYQLVGLIRNDGIRTYRVVEKLSGQPLELHLFAGKDFAEDRRLFEALRALPLSRRRQLIELGEEAGVPYVVTDSLPDVSDIRTYLGGIAGVRAETVQRLLWSKSLRLWPKSLRSPWQSSRRSRCRVKR